MQMCFCLYIPVFQRIEESQKISFSSLGENLRHFTLNCFLMVSQNYPPKYVFLHSVSFNRYILFCSNSIGNICIMSDRIHVLLCIVCIQGIIF